MTILVVHNRYRLRGGEDSVYESECAMLENAGHRVLRYEKSNTDIREDGLWGKLGLALRTVWNPRTCREIRDLIRRERPDVIHCHNTFPVISPSVYWAAAREGVPVVQTLHNYRLCCLNGYLFRNGRICEDCLGRVPWRGVCRRCYRGSAAQSAAVAAMVVVHRLLGTWTRKVARYVALTEFAKGKFAKAGLPEASFSVKPNFCAFEAGSDAKNSRAATHPASFLYLGRLSSEKGPDVLVEAWRQFCDDETGRAAVAAGTRLVIVGDGPEKESLAARAEGLPGIEFPGVMTRPRVKELLGRASALVLPSRCHEQFAMSPMESMAAGTPVIVSSSARHGTIAEDGKTGFFFPVGDAKALAALMLELAKAPERLAVAGRAAREAFLASDCVPERNLERLLEIYRSCGRTPPR